MKKKTLTRKSLDELARTMPVLNEDEQRACIGGTIFYDYSGNYLAKVGTDDDMRVIDNISTINNLKYLSEIMNDHTYSESWRWGNSLAGGGFDTPTLNKIYRHATGVDLMASFNGGITFASGIAAVMLVSVEYGGPSGAVPFFDIVVNHGDPYATNAVTAKNLFVHELYHLNNPTGSQWDRENNAYKAQTSVAGFKSMSEGYRKFIRTQWLNAYSTTKSVSPESIPLSVQMEINAACGF